MKIVEKNDAVAYQRIVPGDLLSDFVKCFWYFHNNTTEEKLFTILPDGYFDVFFSSIDDQPFKCYLMGLGTKPNFY